MLSGMEDALEQKLEGEEQMMEEDEDEVIDIDNPEQLAAKGLKRI